MEDSASFHARSITLPSSGVIHLLHVTAELSKASSSSIYRSLAGVSLLMHRDGVKSVLEGSLTLLDICSATIDALSHMKESILELESLLRRRSGEVCVSSCVSAYKATRRRVIKSASKCLGDLRKSEHKERLESLLVFLSGPKAQHTFPLIAKLMHSSDSEEQANELTKMDRALFAALDAKSLSTDVETTQCVQKQLGALERTIDEIGDGLGLVSRCLVRTRVTLLNVLNH